MLILSNHQLFNVFIKNHESEHDMIIFDIKTLNLFEILFNLRISNLLSLTLTLTLFLMQSTCYFKFHFDFHLGTYLIYNNNNIIRHSKKNFIIYQTPFIHDMIKLIVPRNHL